MIIIPHLILQSGPKILLLRRARNAKIWPGRWHGVTGKIEENETPKEAIIREAKEEIGLTLDVKLAITISLKDKDYFDPNKPFYALELFFHANLPENQTPINCEPLKQEAMNWFLPDELPSPIIPGVKFAIEAFSKGLNYAEFHNFVENPALFV